MTTQSEQVLEKGLIDTLIKMNYQYIQIDDEDALIANFRKTLDIHNKISLTDDKLRRVMIHLASGSIFEKSTEISERFHFESVSNTIK